MKIIGFSKLNKKKKEKKFLILSLTGVFKKSMLIMSVMLFALVLNLIAKTFFGDVAVCLEQFMETFVRLG